jgi:hypothetical protein
MGFHVTKPRRFVAQWMRFHKLNIISIKQLFYAHFEAAKEARRG